MLPNEFTTSDSFIQTTDLSYGISIIRHGDPKPGQYDILLIDDNSDDREQIVRTLTKAQCIHSIYSFECGEGLMAHFAAMGHEADKEENAPTLIFLDIHLPGMDGIEILRELKEHPLARDIPVIIITGNLSDRQMAEVRELKACAFLPKPIQLDNIYELVYNGWGAAS
jgi:CheY-like chemotaxis protein